MIKNYIAFYRINFYCSNLILKNSINGANVTSRYSTVRFGNAASRERLQLPLNGTISFDSIGLTTDSRLCCHK